MSERRGNHHSKRMLSLVICDPSECDMCHLFVDVPGIGFCQLLRKNPKWMIREIVVIGSMCCIPEDKKERYCWKVMKKMVEHAILETNVLSLE